MWYFAWILGVAFACSFAVFNALWLELENDDEVDRF
jgi:cytochrome bd-I ubiquinol oxidase subunit X